MTFHFSSDVRAACYTNCYPKFKSRVILVQNMVRNYVKKKDTGPKYTEEKLNIALNDIKSGVLTTHKASVIYGIPFGTLYSRVKGTRGAIKKTKGRRTALPEDVENVLATSIKTLAKWGFGLSRKEILDLVGQFVRDTKIETPFKDDIPGEDWFLGFKRRHNLSIRKPEQLEYARKKAATDPFIIYGYFSLLKKTLVELNLESKPQQIWNLDESSLSLDPTNSRVVGKKGESSSRVISTSGRENTTFVLAANAAGNRAPPLIIFKAKNIWDQWRAPPEKEYPGTAYAASPNGWMETEIFINYFEKILIPALGPERPVLVIYDGHSTHISLKLVELALAKDITIIKLPAHTSDLLQPLDVSVFKSFKQKWDQTVASWQRQNIGQRLPKSLFSQFLGETWLKVSEDVIMSGFSKSGIYPFNADVIPRTNFPKEALERWEKHQEEIRVTAQDNITLVENVEYAEHNVNAPSPSILSSSAFKEVTSINTNLESQPDFTSPILDPKEKVTSKVQNLTVTSLEQMIFATIQQKHPPNKQKKRKVASGAEVMTSAEMLTELRNKETIKANKKQTGLNKKPSKKRKGKKVTRNLDESSGTDAGSEDEITFEDNKKLKMNKKRKKKIQCLDSDSSSTDAGLEDEVPYDNSDESMRMEEENESNKESNNEKSISVIDSPTGEEDKENEVEETKSQSIYINKWVIVKYALIKGLKYYVGVVQKKVGCRWEVKFVRCKGATFAWPIIEDTDEVTADCIVKILPNPEITKRGIIYFDYKFRNMIIS